MPIDFDPDSIAAVLEPLAISRNYAYGQQEGIVATSQAVSLKRIADALELIAGHLAPTVVKRQFGAPFQPELDLAIPPTATDDGGWIAWPGGDSCPVSPYTLIDVKFRVGDISHKISAGSLYWAHHGPGAGGVGGGDIIAYRVVK